MNTQKPLQQQVKDLFKTRDKIISGIADFGKGAGQSMARSFIALGAEVDERIFKAGTTGTSLGEATFTPREDWQKKLFGTEKPISIKSVGDEVLAIGGDDFQKRWGKTAVPLGFVFAGLEVIPVGFGKRETLNAAAKTIAKTKDINTIKKTIKPLFKEASDDILTGIANGLKNIDKEESIKKIISQIGSVNTTKAGVKTPLIKPSADDPLHQLANFIDKTTLSKESGVTKIENQIKNVQGLRLSGKLEPKEANRMVAGLREQILGVAQKEGIALRITKTGDVKPSIRQSGNFVDDSFVKYPYFQDSQPGIGGGTRDMIRYIQEIDGAKTVAEKLKLPGQAGPLEQGVLWRAHDIIKLRKNWLGQQQIKLKEFAELTGDSTEKVTKMIEKIDTNASKLSVNELLKRKEISKISTDKKIVELAQKARKYFNETIDAQNYFRGKRGQDPIKYRDLYVNHKVKEKSLWSNAWGFGKEPSSLRKAELPDYIKPNKPFIAHDLARQANLPEYAREMDIKRLLEVYTNAAARDIFNTSIIQNNKAYVQQLDSMGLENAARGIEDWTMEAFGGLKSGLDKKMALGNTIESGMKSWRKGLVRSVFPLNFAWNSIVQTSSAVFTVMRYGYINTAAAGFDWFINPKSQKWVADNAYSYIIKTSKGGMSQQDFGVAMADAVRLNKSKLDNATDAANFFTEAIERNLTGISVLAAKREGARRGLKGKALIEYASDGGAKTQSMYNVENLPGILRNEIVKTAAPFQTFSFEGLNTMREWAGKTGTPPSTINERIAWVLRFYAGVTAVNMIGQSTTGREPWTMQGLIPFYSILFSPVEARLKGDWSEVGSSRNLPAPIGIAGEFSNGIQRYMEKGDTTKLRQVSIKYLPGLIGIPGGTQMNRTIDGIIANSAGGVYDSSDRLLFPITETKDKINSIFSGPWSTTGGKEYLEKREKSIWDLFKKEDGEEEDKKRPKTKSRGGITPPPK